MQNIKANKHKEFELNGGVLIIGSLLWDDIPLRANWREKYLKIEEKILVPVPIRYGKISTTWKNNYTMVFSQECKKPNRLGKGYFVPFNDNPQNIITLNEQIFALIKSECKKEKIGNIFFWNWGAIVLSINPKILKEDSTKYNNAMNLIEIWKINFGSGFKEEKYMFDNEKSCIDSSGFLDFDWVEELNEVDFFITAAIIPKHENKNLKKYPTPIEIARKMQESNYSKYFDKNSECGITTFQDNEIRIALNIQFQ